MDTKEKYEAPAIAELQVNLFEVVHGASNIGLPPDIGEDPE